MVTTKDIRFADFLLCGIFEKGVEAVLSKEYGNDFVVLIDEEGIEREYEHIDTLEYMDETYVALVPVPENAEEVLETEGELVILKVIKDENTGEDVLSTIDDDEEYETVGQVFIDRLNDYYEFES